MISFITTMTINDKVFFYDSVHKSLLSQLYEQRLYVGKRVERVSDYDREEKEGNMSEWWMDVAL